MSYYVRTLEMTDNYMYIAFFSGAKLKLTKAAEIVWIFDYEEDGFNMKVADDDSYLISSSTAAKFYKIDGSTGGIIGQAYQVAWPSSSS